MHVRALTAALGASAAFLGLAASAMAAPVAFTSSWTTATMVQTTAGCGSQQLCFQGSGTILNTSIGTKGGTYTVFDKLSQPISGGPGNQVCLTLDPGSNMTLPLGSTGTLVLATDGKWCGSQNNTNTFSLTGNYTISPASTVNSPLGVSGGGTITGIFDPQTRRFSRLQTSDGALTFKSGGGGSSSTGSTVTSSSSSGGNSFGLGATPELDSLVLFGSGALGLAGYGLMRVRARRKVSS